jgi:ABC-type transport system substrate-binding protein
LEDGAVAVDFESRKEIYDEFQMQFLEDMPVAPLIWPNHLVAVNNRVQNVSHGFHWTMLVNNSHEWWVTDGE